MRVVSVFFQEAEITEHRHFTIVSELVSKALDSMYVDFLEGQCYLLTEVDGRSVFNIFQ
jgi:hypothetical protein